MSLRGKQKDHFVQEEVWRSEPCEMEACFQQVFNPEISRNFSSPNWAGWAFLERQAQGLLHLLGYPERGLMRQWTLREVK